MLDVENADCVLCVVGMQEEGLSPDLHCYNQLLWAYKVKGDVAGAERTFEELRGEHGLEPDPITYHALLALYSQVRTGQGRARGEEGGGVCGVMCVVICDVIMGDVWCGVM
jgi:hypothetical protein